MEERWMPIEGFSKYEVSDLGRVRRHRKREIAFYRSIRITTACPCL